MVHGATDVCVLEKSTTLSMECGSDWQFRTYSQWSLHITEATEWKVCTLLQGVMEFPPARLQTFKQFFLIMILHLEEDQVGLGVITVITDNLEAYLFYLQVVIIALYGLQPVMEAKFKLRSLEYESFPSEMLHLHVRQVSHSELVHWLLFWITHHQFTARPLFLLSLFSNLSRQQNWMMAVTAAPLPHWETSLIFLFLHLRELQPNPKLVVHLYEQQQPSGYCCFRPVPGSPGVSSRKNMEEEQVRRENSEGGDRSRILGSRRPKKSNSPAVL